jgi:hypothetical protein
MKTTPQILDKAASIIQTNGWCQNTFKDSDGKYCIIGAMIEASESDRDYFFNNHYSEIFSKLCKAEPLIGASIAAWNDSEDQTKENVISILKKAASLN